MAKKAAKRESLESIAVVVSDCHLQERAWSSRPDLRGDSLHAFQFVMDRAATKGKPVIAAGDLIDKPKIDSLVPDFLREQLYRCSNRNVPVYYIQGQHENQGPGKKPWLSSVSDWPIWLHRSPVRIGSHRVYGIDWTPPDLLPDELAKIPPDTTILVMHQVSPLMGSIVNPEIQWRMIPGHVQLLIIGDYHGLPHSITTKNAEGRNLTVLSPGSTCMQSIDEPIRKYAFTLYDDLTFSEIEIPSRAVLAPPDLETIEDLDGFVEAVGSHIAKAVSSALDLGLPEEMRKPIVRVRYLYDLPTAYARILKAVGDSAYLFHKEIRPATDIDPERQRERTQAIEGGLLGALKQIAPDENSARYLLSRRLLDSADPQQELIRIREEYLREPELTAS